MSNNIRVSIASKVSLVIALLAYFLVSIGALVRTAGAGLSCPDWPLCHGQLVPKQIFTKNVYEQPQAVVKNPDGSSVVATHANSFQIFLEWFHRLIAGIISLGLLTLTVLNVKNHELRKKNLKTNIIAILLLITQIVLGGLTVLGLLSPKWVASHLAVGLLFFTTLLVLAIHTREVFKNKTITFKKNFYIQFALVSIFVLYFQAVLGGLVSSNYAGLACLDFPKCNGEWIPSLVGPIKFQFFHRLGALIAFIVLLSFSIVAIAYTSKYKISKISNLVIYFFPWLVLFQISLGIGLIFMKLPLLMSVAHLAVAAALLASLVIIFHEFLYISNGLRAVKNE
jgi:cytochrome c oxidase assembly protein subunit 15